MKILVTGAAGFIGNEIALRLLEEGHTVTGVDCFTPYYDPKLKEARAARLTGYEGFRMERIRVEDAEAMEAVFRRDEPEIVVHFAAQAGVRYSLDHPRDYVDSNVVGSFNVIEFSRRYGARHLVLASTSSAYGANETYPFHERDAAPYPLTIYAATKLASELIAHSHAHLYGVPTTALRFFTVYGPWGRPDMALYKFTDCVFKGQPIDVFNHGDLIRDFTYIGDLVESIRRLMDTPPVAGQKVIEADSVSPVAPFRMVNIGNAKPVRLLDYIDAIEEATGRKAIMNMLDMQPGDVKQTFADVSLLKALTGYTPNTDYRKGVARFVDWYRGYFKPD
ncbi:NAD-dependent epimerase/dehydratase family protein [Hyphomonas sp. WL0036]|uniref:NAD-dependent epimerase/dehydratase family protein n=1 Tax=Hyphomonas sediminis TaxID=2866160 RepID=UPI001C7FCDDB|nr:NAD-dependent epimerase/dehydratase family protein [Hyphomonas sediminis]MBY9066875.1 NAD-dependent epimerase/dehydratase family protein [Hyphomonas sediminis]